MYKLNFQKNRKEGLLNYEEENKKILLTSSVLGLSFTGVTVGQEIISPESQVVHGAQLYKWARSLSFKIIGSVGNKLYNVKASKSTGKYGETITPGSIPFNSGKYGAEVSYPIDALSTNHSVALFATTNPFNWGSKISIILRSPSGSRVINASLTDGQRRGYVFARKGRYTASFVSSARKKWAPYIAYRYDKGNSVYKIAKSLLPTSEEDSNTGQFEEVNGYGEVLKPEWNEQEVLVSDKTASINMTQMLDQLKDDNGIYVYAMRDYNEHDTVEFSDSIKSISYDKDLNETVFSFSTTNEEEYNLKFAGNLVNEYSENDNLNLKFEVEKLSESSEDFKIPNYYKYLLDNENKAPQIEDYLVTE